MKHAVSLQVVDHTPALMVKESHPARPRSPCGQQEVHSTALPRATWDTMSSSRLGAAGPLPWPAVSLNTTYHPVGPEQQQQQQQQQKQQQQQQQQHYGASERTLITRTCSVQWRLLHTDGMDSPLVGLPRQMMSGSHTTPFSIHCQNTAMGAHCCCSHSYMTPT
jgi:hypothetical protein